MALNYITSLNERSNCSENVVFAMLYTHNWSMALRVLTSLINIAIVTPMSYSIIWYERFGSDYRRTLLNQLISSICWNIVFQNMVNVPLEIILTTFGPLGEAFCLSHMILKNGSTFHIYTLLTFLTSVKYLYIFVFKNPTGIQSVLVFCHQYYYCHCISSYTDSIFNCPRKKSHYFLHLYWTSFRLSSSSTT